MGERSPEIVTPSQYTTFRSRHRHSRHGEAAMRHQGSTADDILDVAEELMKSHGWSAVSYADLAKRVGIRTASIHHHYPSKTDLGQALVRRYTADFERVLDDIQARPGDAAQHLSDYFRVVHDAMGDGSAMCLCARLAADYTS